MCPLVSNYNFNVGSGHFTLQETSIKNSTWEIDYKTEFCLLFYLFLHSLTSCYFVAIYLTNFCFHLTLEYPLLIHLFISFVFLLSRMGKFHVYTQHKVTL